MYALFRKIRKHNLTVDIQLKLFDQIVLPVLLYQAEIWGHENLNDIETFHRNFLKIILKVNKSTPSFMIYGELGRFPLEGIVYSRMIKYWSKLLIDKPNKIASLTYKFIYQLHKDSDYNTRWLNKIKFILESTGLNNIWLDQSVMNSKWLANKVKLTFNDFYIQVWHNEISNSS